jgi:peptidase M48-like protein
MDPAEAAEVHARAQAALARLADAGAGVTVRVLGESDPAAFAWRDGTVFVTRGLVALLSDDELAAALAHELGHLTGRGDGLPGPAAELLADRIGGEVLRVSGLPPGLMLHMLRKLDPGDAHIAARIAALEAPADLLAAAD